MSELIEPINAKSNYTTTSAQRRGYKKYHASHEQLTGIFVKGTKNEILQYGFNPNELFKTLLFDALDRYERGESI